MSAEQMNKYIEYKIEKLIAMMEKLPADSKVKVPLEFLELINVDGGFDSDTDDDEGSTTNEEVDTPIRIVVGTWGEIPEESCEKCDKPFNHPIKRNNELCDCAYEDDGTIYTLDEWSKLACLNNKNK